MTTPQQIVDIIDAGLGHGGGGVVGPIRVTDCARTGCTRKPELGHDFCAECLAWLRFEVDDDPLDDQPATPTSAPLLPDLAGEVDDEDWYCYLTAAIAGYS